MQIVIGAVLLIVCVGMIYVARPARGADSAPWLAKPWFLGQLYVLAALVLAVVGISFILNNSPS
jgi:hypothetical protein